MQKGMFYGANQHQTRFSNVSQPSLHAEMNALKHYLTITFGTSSIKLGKKVNIKRTNGIVYVVRVLQTRENLPKSQQCWFGNSKPCARCQHYLARYGFKKIKYTNIIDGINVLCEMKLKK